MKLFIAFFATLFLQNNFANAATTKWQESPEKAAQVRLIASYYEDQNGDKKLITALHFKIKHGWKIYGKGSDSFGLPPIIDFKNSKNYLSHEIIWPKAEIAKEKIGEENIEYLYYKNEVILPIEIVLKDKAKAETLTAKLDYGICSDVCIPASAEFLLQVPTTEDRKILNDISKFYSNEIIEKEMPNKMQAISYMIALALLGGVILNIMPCVLPVLSIKLISVIKHLDSHISRIRFAFISTITGILFCFLILASIASVIKIGGDSFGWGFQFQNSYFLVFLILILVFFIANLLGVFEITFDQFVSDFLNKEITKREQKKNIFIPNFLSGVLAVLLATPCSAPFLGSAISFALTQQITTIFIIFFCIGLGFALPYIILSITPRLVYLLPKPGKWMLKIKKLMALFLSITILWLLYVLSYNNHINLSLMVAALVLALYFVLKIKNKIFKIFLIFLIITLSFFSTNLTENKKVTDLNNIDWIEFDESKIPVYVAEGKTVIIDITANWCLTCKFNKIRVLNDKEIIERLNQPNIIKMRGDITKPNKTIMKFLHKNGRFAIPFNAIYGPNAKNGLLTSELLNKNSLLQLLNQASK